MLETGWSLAILDKSWCRYIFTNAMLCLQPARMLLLTSWALEEMPSPCTTRGARCCPSAQVRACGGKPVLSACCIRIVGSTMSKNLEKSLRIFKQLWPKAANASLRVHLAKAVIDAEDPLQQASCGAWASTSQDSMLFICLLTNLYNIGVLQMVLCPTGLPRRGLRFRRDWKGWHSMCEARFKCNAISALLTFGIARISSLHQWSTPLDLLRYLKAALNKSCSSKSKVTGVSRASWRNLLKETLVASWVSGPGSHNLQYPFAIS